jgi:hypothetical protein
MYPKQQAKMLNWKRSTFLLFVLMMFIPEFLECAPEGKNQNDLPMPVSGIQMVGRSREESLHSLYCSVIVSNRDSGAYVLLCRLK